MASHPSAGLALLLLLLLPPAVAFSPARPAWGQASAPAPVAAPPSRPAPSLQAASAILVAGDGTVLWEQNSRSRRAIASTTKIMTALVAIERTRPGDTVTASPRAEAVGATDALVTELELVAGERLTVEQLLYGLLLPSGSDAAVALAEHVGGSVEAFASLMNGKAQQIGAMDSNFTNADGLDDPGAYSTAADLAIMTRAAMEKDLFRTIVATLTLDIPRAGSSEPRRLVNRNLLLGSFEGADGVKTGNTRNAGRSLVASATRGSEERIAVVLGSPDPIAESALILQYGFDAFHKVEITRAGQRWGQVTYGDGTTLDLVAGRDASVVLGVGSPLPSARFRPAGNVLVVDGPGGLTVPLDLRCGQAECSPPTKERGSALARFVSLLGPLLRLLR
ncbi:MAG: D-alanyl-D-alanine carboxypeptidase family protein [Actinomycetota bacterium]